MKTLIQKVKEELKKVNLEAELVKECNDKFIIKILEDNKIVLKSWEVQKCLQWNKVDSFVKMTRKQVDDMKKLIAMGVLTDEIR